MARKYRLSLIGCTGGSYELHCVHQGGGPVWSSGFLRIGATPGQIVDSLMPGLDVRIDYVPAPGMSNDNTDRCDAHLWPKVYDITLDGSIWAPQSGQLLTGMASPTARVEYRGFVDSRDQGPGIETPETATVI